MIKISELQKLVFADKDKRFLQNFASIFLIRKDNGLNIEKQTQLDSKKVIVTQENHK